MPISMEPCPNYGSDYVKMIYLIGLVETGLTALQLVFFFRMSDDHLLDYI